LTHHVVPVIAGIVKQWTEAGGSVVFTRFINETGSAFERLIGWYRLKEQPDIDLCDEIVPYAMTVVDKNFYSAFRSDFTNLIQRSGWKNVVVCGLETDSCILKTAVDAFELGYTPFVLTDACATHAGEHLHDAALRILQRFIGTRQIVRSETLFEMMSITREVIG
jgi:nicotinamidase-related amidase